MADSAAVWQKRWEEGDWPLLLQCIRESALRHAKLHRLTVDDAEDIASATVVRVLRYVKATPDNPVAFLETCVRNQMRDVIKIRKRHQELEPDVEEAWYGKSRTNALDRMTLDESMKTIDDSTDERQKELLLYMTREIDGETMAAMHGTNVGVIKMRAVRLRARLRKALT